MVRFVVGADLQLVHQVLHSAREASHVVCEALARQRRSCSAPIIRVIAVSVGGVVGVLGCVGVLVRIGVPTRVARHLQELKRRARAVHRGEAMASGGHLHKALALVRRRSRLARDLATHCALKLQRQHALRQTGEARDRLPEILILEGDYVGAIRQAALNQVDWRATTEVAICGDLFRQGRSLWEVQVQHLQRVCLGLFVLLASLPLFLEAAPQRLQLCQRGVDAVLNALHPILQLRDRLLCLHQRSP
mmetsp:Transcript_92228/g.266169  ORF Transcript_92228/g.266169 Transcript_92228/m.266169 type:complete len:248 (+) Transcript_92228:1437-2180(+)